MELKTLRSSIVFIGLIMTAPLFAGPSDLTTLSLEELLQMEVTSVSKNAEKSFKAPAAIAVITQDEIRRFGATSIPEALRLLPGVQVARINSNQWSVGVRGFGSRLSRSTLVLIDGRSVYSPLFAGTYWEVQDTLLEDIDRIELIRGPGGALWGANAVNGVINIITKNSKETHGTLVSAGGGSEEKDFGSFRHGGIAGRNFNYRYYGKYMDRDSSFNRVGDNFDDWRIGQAGFRTDWDARKNDTLTIQGDAYRGEAGQRLTNSTYTFPFRETVEKDSDLSGANVLGRWDHKKGLSDRQLQLYYDRTHRRDPNFEETRDTVDIDFQHSLPVLKKQQLTYGAGSRLSTDNTDATLPTLVFNPMNRTDTLWSVFVQDQIPLVKNKLELTVGTKIERNDYTGWETQPNGRIAWTPTETQTLWGAVSRAVRTPSRVESDLDLTAVLSPGTSTFARVTGNKNFGTEKVVAYEMGYRAMPLDSVVFGISGFYNDYDDLLSVGSGGAPFSESNPPPTKTVVPFVFENKLKGKTYGGEFGSTFGVVEWWRFRASYSYLRMNLQSKEGSLDTTTAAATEGASPRHQAVFRSLMNLPRSLELDPTFRYVSGVPSQGVRAYWELDVHLGWRPEGHFEFSLVGQNLLRARHPEAAGTNEVERGVYGKITWRS